MLNRHVNNVLATGLLVALIAWLPPTQIVLAFGWLFGRHLLVSTFNMNLGLAGVIVGLVLSGLVVYGAYSGVSWVSRKNRGIA